MEMSRGSGWTPQTCSRTYRENCSLYANTVRSREEGGSEGKKRWDRNGIRYLALGNDWNGHDSEHGCVTTSNGLLSWCSCNSLWVSKRLED